MRRAVENLANILEPDPAIRYELRSAMLDDWRHPAHMPERNIQINRGMLHVSLAAARVRSESHLGDLIRRQMGVAAYAMVDKGKRDCEISRTSAATYSLWGGACYLVARHFPQDDQPYDFEAQAALTGRCLLGLDVD